VGTTTHLRLAISLVALVVFCSATQVDAAEGVIYQAAYRLKLSDKEDAPYRDYFANIGSRHGVQVGEVLEVLRAVPAVNALWGGVSALLEVVIGEVQVLAVSPAGSIVRMVKQTEPERMPVLQYSRFMIGDSVRSKISFANVQKPSLQ
jgi:hypothetical protein